ncbi:uncharacterized protein BDR25DRAFT_356007 [Lindgomyces ingoldianus]|uniref:Uncharacterized protein n=1 Tax=Lindgomyces ingoldianus TaxID=673940 RepID=A0ACB6QRX7_9PLEO|nr:uncharacterized protein BDR25DRAFT_356007 [Lindgomyces ingoldianus]KAF2469749.1 hypothetical protein BDR25DRAFT_356007 [Lindgomyces ingoldianus]
MPLKDMVGVMSAPEATLFLGAAISSFQPTCFPIWDKFIEIVYSSLVDRSTEDVGVDSQGSYLCIAEALNWKNPRRVPNYKVTEIIARRLGKDYLRLLKAFETQKKGDIWLVNHVHRWAAQCLMDGSAAAVVTTNFDDCLEKALRNAQANTYTLTNNFHIDSDAIVNRLGETSDKLIIVVSGPEACRFAQTLLPQLGGNISFLFKLHGSCYMPDTCIDTRLQRQQGLPSYAVDILDSLLIKSTFFVVGFSGGDLNDNTDYLRMVHNKREGRLVWLQVDLDKMEPGLQALLKSVPTEEHTSEGLCLLQGSIPGERVKGNENPTDFSNFVATWSGNLGSSWCKLVVLDLIELCHGTESEKVPLSRLGFVDGTRQDWNRVLETELGPLRDQEQYGLAKECSNIATLLQYLFSGDLDEGQRAYISSQVENERSKIRLRHLDLAQTLNTHHPHAQSWVISALYGLLLFCGGQERAASEALSFAQNTAYLVGDLQASDMTKSLLEKLNLRKAPSEYQLPKSKLEDTQRTSSVVAFIPSLDNVSAKANQYGVPPALFLRGLLHRAILFADSIAIPPNVLTNSSVFINELLFSSKDHLNTFYLNFLHPVIPLSEGPGNEKTILSKYRTTVASNYISEKIAESQIQALDAHFESIGIDNSCIFYSSEEITGNYYKYLRRAVLERQDSTKAYLLDRWRSLRSSRLDVFSDTIKTQDEDLAAAMVDTIIGTVNLFVQNLKDQLTRSKLYNLAGLFATVVDHHEAIDKPLKDEIEPEIRNQLISGRMKILHRPWVSGPLCHELFDVPYRGNLPIHLIMKSSSPRSLIFLDEDEISSWRFIASLLDDSKSLRLNDSAVSIGSSAQISALLLGQASEQDLCVTRDALAQVRRKLATQEQLDRQTKDAIAREMRVFATASVDVEDEPIITIPSLDQKTREVLQQFLGQCVFLVRKSEAVDRMYEEPQFTLPGMLALERALDPITTQDMNEIAEVLASEDQDAVTIDLHDAKRYFLSKLPFLLSKDN